jgi:glucokinase
MRMDPLKIKTRVVGVDISLGETTFAIVDLRGNFIAEDRFPTTAYPDINGFVTKLSDSILALVESNGGYDTIRSVGISAPSANYRSGSIMNSPNLPWKGTIPLAAMLRDRMALAVAVANNAHATCLGEHMFGSAHGMDTFILLTLGHGMGSCMFADGRPYRGSEGYAGEIGHTCYEPGGRLCGCGKRGCLERYTAEGGIIQTAQELMAASSEPSLMRQADRLTPKVIAEYCDRGDSLAIETYRLTGKALGIGLANYATLTDPEAIILTGGIANAGRWLLEPAQESFDAHVFHNIRGKVRLMVSPLNDRNRDVLGASALAWKVKEYSLFK